MPLIQAKNLKKSYTSGEIETIALNNATFTIDKGEFVAIMGPSGSGKSTLMHILSFLTKPSSGEYLFKGVQAQKLTEDQMAKLRNQEIGFVFQTFNLLPRTTVFENVSLPLIYGTKENSTHAKLVNNAIKSVSLTHRKNYLSNQLSGGEKQRVAIARALVNQPEIIFADEPTGNLDSKAGTQIMKILQKLNDQGKTIIMVTHETDTAEHAKRIITLKDGEITGDRKVEAKRIKNGELLKK